MPVFEERFEVPAPPDAVWPLLLDPRRLAACIPGCTGLDVVDERTWRLGLTVKVGFVSTSQDVLMRILEATPPRRLVTEGRGEDARLSSRIDVRNSVDLEPMAGGGTQVSYRSEVTVLGRLGSVGDAVMRVKARELSGEFARRVRAALGGTA